MGDAITSVRHRCESSLVDRDLLAEDLVHPGMGFHQPDGLGSAHRDRCVHAVARGVEERVEVPGFHYQGRVQGREVGLEEVLGGDPGTW